MAHPNARLTPATRLEMVLEVEAGWSQAEVARRFRVSRATVAKWWRRYREEGAAGLRDRSSAPRSNPRRTAAALEQRICAVRRSQGFGPHRIAWALGIARSTAYAVLRRCGLNRLDRLHRVTRRTLRYEHPAPGDLLHIVGMTTPFGPTLMSTFSDFVRLTVQRKCPFGWSLMVDDAAPWHPGGPPARTYLLMVLREMPSSRAVARIESPCRRAC